LPGSNEKQRNELPIMVEIKIDGYVARLITDDELVLNIGSEAGVSVGDIFEVLDSATIGVPDPRTGKVLGSLRRAKTQIQVSQVAENLSLARNTGPRSSLSALSRVVSGTGNALLTGSSWPDGVRVGDPVALRTMKKPQISPSS